MGLLAEGNVGLQGARQAAARPCPDGAELEIDLDPCPTVQPLLQINKVKSATRIARLQREC